MKQGITVEEKEKVNKYLDDVYYQGISKNVVQIVTTRRRLVWSEQKEKLCKGNPYNPLDYTFLSDFLSEVDKVEDDRTLMFRETLVGYVIENLTLQQERQVMNILREFPNIVYEEAQALYIEWLEGMKQCNVQVIGLLPFWPLYETGCRLLNLTVKDTNMLDSEADKLTVQTIKETYLECFKRNPMPQHKIKPFLIPVIQKELVDELKSQLSVNVYYGGLGIDTYLKKNKGLMHTYLRHNKYINAHPEITIKLETEEINQLFYELIEKVALLEGYYYTLYVKDKLDAPTAKQILKYNKCKMEAFTFDLVHTYRKSYIEEHTRQAILKKLPKNPKNAYPRARSMHRHFIINYGDTNTGKTYHALEALKLAKQGTYLAPLRLLALEVQEKLLAADIVCDLRTGEEELLYQDATHSSCTVEKANLNMHYDVCVIDECQLVAEVQRGWAWTRAILGVQADVIYVCAAREGVEILKTLITECGDTYELREYTRETELQVENKDFIFPLDVKKGDAIVCFSKKHVLGLAAELRDIGIKPSILYGALPYGTRKKQVERFANGETDVVVCTDCIGMGINLAIKRVVFIESTKFDGIEKRELTSPEIKQIAGRAGRRNMYKYGYVAAQSHRKQIARAIKEVVPQIETVRLGFEDSLVNIDADILDILKVWQSIPDKGIYIKTNIDRTIELVDTLRQMEIELEKDKLLALANIPFDERIVEVLDLWKAYAKAYANGCDTLDKPQLGESKHTTLESLEVYYKCLDMYYAFSKNFKLPFDYIWLTAEKEEIADRINKLLLDTMGQSKRTCKQCGKAIPWDFIYTLCDDCYYKMHFSKEDKM